MNSIVTNRIRNAFPCYFVLMIPRTGSTRNLSSALSAQQLDSLFLSLHWARTSWTLGK